MCDHDFVLAVAGGERDPPPPPHTLGLTCSIVLRLLVDRRIVMVKLETDERG